MTTELTVALFARLRSLLNPMSHKFDIVDEIKKYIYHGYVAATAVQTSHY